VRLGAGRFTLLLALLAGSPALQAQECVMGEPGCRFDFGPCPLESLLFEDLGGYVVPPVRARPFNPDAGERVRVRGFVVEGFGAKPEGALQPADIQAAADQAFTEFSEGEPEARMTVGQMQRIADAVTSLIRGNGYLVAKAYLPVQTIDDSGIVRIQVLEGLIGKVTVEGANRYSGDVLARSAAPLAGQVATRDNVETAILHGQDYPGVRLFGTFRPGSETGETDFVLQVLGEERFGFRIGGDNYGNEFTGVYRIRLDANWNNPVGRGDRLNLTLMQAVAPENTALGALDYRVPVGPRGMSFRLGANHNSFRAAEDIFAVLDLEGTITTYETGVDWRFVRSRFFNAGAGLSYARKESELLALTSIQLTEDILNVATLGAGFDRIDTRFRGVDDVYFGMRQGFASELTDSNLASEFTIADVRYTRLQALTETQMVLLRLRGQYTNERLSTLEQFPLAGPDSVRAYPVGEVLADVGGFASLEYRVQAPGFSRASGPFNRTWGDLLQFWIFTDYAYGETAVGSARRELSGYGASVQFALPGTFRFLVHGAWPLSSVVASDGDDFRLFGEFSWSF
jgi:hemolysin activation/secretion protein